MLEKSKIDNELKKMQEFFNNKKFLFAAWACNNKNFSGLSSWIPVLKNYFNNFIIFDPQEHLYNYGKKQMNQQFLELVEKEKPDYIFFWLIYDQFYIDTLLKIKELSPSTKMINFFGDDDTFFESFSRFYTLFFDYYITIPQIPKNIYKKEGIKNPFYFIPISDDKSFKPLDLGKTYDVTFIGTPKVDRIDFIKYLINNGIKIKIFGQGWDKYEEFKDIYGGQLNNEDFVKIINQSKINLCFTKNYASKLHIKGRIFEVGACNSFALVEYFSGYLKFFRNNKEIVFFKNKEELLEKVKYYLKNETEREKIAKAAYERIIKEHNLDKKIRELLYRIFREKNKLPVKTSLNLNKKVAYLSKEDLDNFDIKNKIADSDYICFKDNNSKVCKYRDFFQAYSLIKSKKQISCCDYYLSSKKLGDFLTFQSYFVINSNKNSFYNFLNPGQIMVTKEFFLKNLNPFKLIFKHDFSFMKENNFILVSIPLIKLAEVDTSDYEVIKNTFIMSFFYDIYPLYTQKKFFSPYFFNITIEYLKGNTFFLKYIHEKISSKFR